MIADDFRRLLEAEGAAIVGMVGTVEAALEAIDREEPELAILDIDLRGRSAHEVAQRCQARGIMAVAVTGRAQDALRMGFSEREIIPKPYSRKDFMAVVGERMGVSPAD